MTEQSQNCVTLTIRNKTYLVLVSAVSFTKDNGIHGSTTQKGWWLPQVKQAAAIVHYIQSSIAQGEWGNRLGTFTGADPTAQ